jgi:hypothetical protein
MEVLLAIGEQIGPLGIELDGLGQSRGKACPFRPSICHASLANLCLKSAAWDDQVIEEASQ